MTIKYNISGLQNRDIEKIEAILFPLETEYFNMYKSQFPDYPIPRLYIIFSENIWKDIEQFYSENGFTLDELLPKGLDHLMKVITLNGTTKYFWNAKYFAESAIKDFFAVIIGDLISKQLETKYEIKNQIRFDHGIDGLSKTLFDNWVIHLSSKNSALKITNSKNSDFDSMEDLTFAFKRNIKQLHFNYQSNIDNDKFLKKAILELDIYIRRILSYDRINNLRGLEEFEDEIRSLIAEINNSLHSIESIDSKEYSICRKNVDRILKKCDIEIYENIDLKSMGFRINKGPKNLFSDLIDTHPRIVCFIDILGFKALINEYESQDSSLVLKKLKMTFDSARQIAFNMLSKILGDDFKREIEFRMFSDCITISLPIIEFGVDIKMGFYDMAIVVNVFQQTFMQKGFYLRGHITIGSYYSDKNMLFSGGLVEAYINEGPTIYPVVSINTKIIDKIKLKTEYDESIPSFNKLIILHSFGNTNLNTILNPFFTFESYQRIDDQINRVLSSLFGSPYSKPGIDFSFKKIFEAELNKQGINEIESGFKRYKNEIIQVLAEKYNEQIQIYQELRNSHKERMEASKIIEKYKFLLAMLNWLSNENDSNFSFLEF